MKKIRFILKIRHMLFDNSGLKLFSVLTAAVIWFFVVIVNKPELNFIVPLKFKNIPQEMELVGEKEYELEIRVKGPQSALNSLNSRQIKASLDLRNATPGVGIYRLSPRNIRLPAGVQANRIIPRQVTVKLEPLMERLVPVEAVVLGVPADGYELKEVAVFPKTVRVIGAKSKVEELKSVRTASLNITGFDTSVSKKLKLVPLADKLQLSNGSTVEVRAIIEEKKEEKQLVVPVQITPAGWKVEFEPATVKVVASGPISKIRALKSTEFTATIALLELKPGQVLLEVKLQLPPDIVLISQEPKEVKVVSIEKPPQDELSRPTIGGSIPKAQTEVPAQ